MWSFILEIFKKIKWSPLRISMIINVLLALFIMFLFKSGDIKKPEVIVETVTITVPGKDGKMDTIFYPKPYKVVNPVNTELLKQYTTLKDSVKKLEMYEDAIAEREYNELYEDKTQKISIYTKVQGKLLKQAPTYFIKPINIQVQDTIIINNDKQSSNKLLIGGEIGLPSNHVPILKSSIYFQNKKDNLISIGYDTNKTIWAGYIYKIKLR